MFGQFEPRSNGTRDISIKCGIVGLRKLEFSFTLLSSFFNGDCFSYLKISVLFFGFVLFLWCVCVFSLQDELSIT